MEVSSMYERETINMSKGKEKKKNTKKETTDKPEKRSPWKIIAEHPVSSGLICAFICFMGSVFLDIHRLTVQFPDVIEDTSKIEDIQTSVAVLNTRIDYLESRINSMDSSMNNTRYLNPTSTDIISITQNPVTTEYHLSSPEWSGEDVIAVDDSTGIEYCAAELVDQKLLLPYTDSGQEIIFYGQYNEQYHWDGNCIINVYKDNALILIMEAYYADGTLLAYKQVLPYITKSEKDAWIVSQRINTGEENVGDSWSYYRDSAYEKVFSLDNVTVSDVLCVDDFKNTYCTKLEGFYHGNTSNGSYNDDTGNAYMVKYAADGTVRTLYVGNFEDGHFNDDTGNAWYITRNDETNTVYMYYQGYFKDDVPLHNTESQFIHDISLEQINEIIGDREFDVELIWYESVH